VDTVAGVDGCPRGWVAAVVRGRSVEWRVFGLSFRALLDGLADCAMVAVDVPIGLPDTGARKCDVTAREFLGPARSSVFLTPPRAVLVAPDHAAASAVARGIDGKGISRQAWNIGARVLDATDTVEADPALAGRVVEAHPEVSFALMTGAALPSKHTAAGLVARIAALGEQVDDVLAVLAAAPRPARADDALDALACAWTARRVLSGDAVALPDGAVGAPRIVG
jgi:predicted RNase H-like nuclease